MRLLASSTALGTVWFLLTAGGTTALGPAACAEEQELTAKFFLLCDAGYPIVEKQARTAERIGRAFYWDSYVVRALAVAHDMTGNEKYLAACKLWSDRMLEYQQGMTPRGAYYMQYGRRPGEDEGNWYVADCSSIALGVLATAIRCQRPEEKNRYLDSVRLFAPTGGRSLGEADRRGDRRVLAEVRR